MCVAAADSRHESLDTSNRKESGRYRSYRQGNKGLLNSREKQVTQGKARAGTRATRGRSLAGGGAGARSAGGGRLCSIRLGIAEGIKRAAFLLVDTSDCVPHLGEEAHDGANRSLPDSSLIAAGRSQSATRHHEDRQQSCHDGGCSSRHARILSGRLIRLPPRQPEWRPLHQRCSQGGTNGPEKGTDCPGIGQVRAAVPVQARKSSGDALSICREKFALTHAEEG
jgi:hypothetical protein